MIKTEKITCSVCDSRNLVNVLDLPQFPLTGIYLKNPADLRYQGIDQGLMLCWKCGHGQLKNILDPNLVYDTTYFHRSSGSDIAKTGNDFFAQFLQKIVAQKNFNCVVEIGCNDLFLLKKIEPLGKKVFGVDPIWKSQELPQHEKIKVLGKFVEELEFSDFGARPDLIISAHTFEHLENPKEQLARLVDFADHNALFVIEVPSFDSLLEIYRFDQVFHQHIQYFSLASFEKMLHEVGCKYLTHTFNFAYWGGTMLIAFQKNSATRASFQNQFTKPNEDLVKEKVQMFQRQFNESRRTIDSLKNQTIYGYGAAQMLPTVAYHLKSDFAFMKSVLDDNPEREGLMYPNMPVKIERPGDHFTLKGSNVMITALDSLRPIMKRVFSLGAKRVLVPLNIF